MRGEEGEWEEESWIGVCGEGVAEAKLVFSMTPAHYCINCHLLISHIITTSLSVSTLVE